jgi:hypothetical protein
LLLDELDPDLEDLCLDDDDVECLDGAALSTLASAQ